MRNKLGTLSMVLGAALVIAALSLLLWNQWEAKRAEEAANAALGQVLEEIDAARESGAADPYAPEMPETMIDGYEYIGCLSVPVLGLDLPVMAQWDYVRLKLAPCRYVGSTRTDDLVIAAHNYEHHFGRLKELAPGDEVYFTDMEGIVTRYEVAEVLVLEPTAVEEMVSSDFDLTLFTCTYGGKTRVTVRCVRG